MPSKKRAIHKKKDKEQNNLDLEARRLLKRGDAVFKALSFL